MKKIISAAAVFVCAVAFGQNINPTVEVTNTYQGNPSEVHKPQLGMAIPDSLMRFDMDFGYEVFDKPYQGAYNFKPYMLNMRPDKDAYRGRKLYLKAGAGYSLHPQLDFVFSPEQKGPFQMSVYAGHRSYFGNYNLIRPTAYEHDRYKLDKAVGMSYNGYDALTTAGFEGRYNWEQSVLSFGIGYYGLMTKDSILTRSYNAADFKVRFRSNRDEEKYIFYDVALKGRFGSEGLNYAGVNKLYGYIPEITSRLPQMCFMGGKGKLSEGSFLLDANIGPVFSYSRRLIVGLEAETSSYGGDFVNGNGGRIALVPKYQIKTGGWDLSLGVRVEKLFRKNQDTTVFKPMFMKEGSLLYPDVHVSYAPMDNLLLYAKLTGGAHMNTYSSLIAGNHHFNPSYAFENQLMDNTIEKINFKVGVKGNLYSKFQYDISGGMAKIDNGYLEAPFMDNPFLVGSTFNDYSLVYGDILMGLEAGGFDLSAGIHLRKTTFDSDLWQQSNGFKLPLFSGDFKAVYNFSPRLYAGVNVFTCSSREGTSGFALLPSGFDQRPSFVKIPGYVDLGLLAGYKLNRKLGVWLESGNLLCENIQRNPYYSEKDFWITAGITLSL